jgi:hypothetical protein
MTKFLRARAAAVGFASLTSPRSSSGTTINSHSNLISGRDSYSDEEDGAYLDSDEEDDAEVTTDLDMLPTMLVYRAGQVVHNWIRVDWEAAAWTKHGDKRDDMNASSVEALLRGLV